jgi:hypothetical protein
MKLGEKNVGMADRVIRIVVGFFVLGFAAKYLDFPLNIAIEILGFIIAATGVIGYCTLYSFLGISTIGLATAKPAQPAPPKARRKAKNA